MVSKGKSARRKGHDFERKIAQDFVDIGYKNARRHLEYQKEVGDEGRDLDNTGRFLVQCKAHKDYTSINAIKQIKRTPLGIPLLITKGDRKEPMAVMPWKDLKWILANEKSHSSVHGGDGVL